MEIKNSIGNLYKTFSEYYIVENLRNRSCDCCVTKSDIKSLLSKQLKDLSEEDLGHFMRKAITTFGDENDYKHFLPRILELLKDNDNLIDDFITFEKLNYTNWETWDENEVNAIKSYFLSLWLDALIGNNDNQYFENVFVLVLQYLEYDIVFKEWEKHFTENRIKIILDYVLKGFDFNITKEKDHAFSEWITSKLILDKLEVLYEKVDDSYLAKEISIAYTILERNYGNKKNKVVRKTSSKKLFFR